MNLIILTLSLSKWIRGKNEQGVAKWLVTLKSTGIDLADSLQTQHLVYPFSC